MSGGAALAIALGLATTLVTAAGMADDDLRARWQSLEPYFRDYRPSGPGPFPAVLLVSGCNGFAPRNAPQIYTDMAEDWRTKGYVVVFVDYLSARGRNRCPSVTPADLGKDVLAVASHLRDQSLIDPERVSAIGWSLGGSGVLAALAQIDPGERIPLHAVVAYYPVCEKLQPWSVAVPALVLMGANDKTARPAACQQLFARLALHTSLETRLYPDAGHGFNIPEPPPVVRYSAAATVAAAHEVDQFLSR
jgi:dienelactone hydrolase